MAKVKDLNERSIKVALEKGLITKLEADQMLRVYLYTSTSSPLPKANMDIRATASSSTSRTH